MKKKINLFWFRRDLRVEDNCGFYHALVAGLEVVPVFVFDTGILQQLPDKWDRRVTFIYEEVKKLKQYFETKGSSLQVVHGTPEQAFCSIMSEYEVSAVYCNHDYEPYGMQRDDEIKQLLEKKNVAFFSYKDQVIFEKNEVTKDDGTPYQVFTPYAKRWKEKLKTTPVIHYPSEEQLKKLAKLPKVPMMDIERIGFISNRAELPRPQLTHEMLRDYERNRDFPAVMGTSKLSLYLRFGTVSIRTLVHKAINSSDKWLNELIWREFYQMILFHYPHVAKSCFKKEYNFIVWENNEDYFKRWCEGQTGYPIVDAGMRELNQTGWMHNRVRMITAGFLCKNLLIDWRWGEQYFADKLLDFELASNNGGWQWSAGCGVDAAPYFRIFNPTVQAKKFDPLNAYINKWVPEAGTAAYPLPLVDHKVAVEKTIAVYKQALTKNK